MNKIKVSKMAVSTISKAFKFFFAKKRYHLLLEKCDSKYTSDFLEGFRVKKGSQVAKFDEGFSQMIKSFDDSQFTSNNELANIKQRAIVKKVMNEVNESYGSLQSSLIDFRHEMDEFRAYQ